MYTYVYILIYALYMHSLQFYIVLVLVYYSLICYSYTQNEMLFKKKKLTVEK